MRNWLCLTVGLCAVLVGCSPEPAFVTGSAQMVAVVPSAAQAQSIAQVTVTVTGPDMAPVSGALVKGSGGWSALLSPLPAGSQRTFTAQAFDALNIMRFEGQVTGVTITGGQTVAVTLTLQEVTSPPDFNNNTPRITSLVASTNTVAPGGTVTLEASALDPDSGDTLTYAWTAQSGTFSAPASSSTTWTAPSTEGLVTLSVTVSDPHGATASLGVTLGVSTEGLGGGAAVTALLNTWPQVARVTAMPSSVEVGGSTEVTATVADADGDALTYQWSSGCEGVWTDASSPTARFTPTVQPPATGGDCGRCPLTVTVSDGRGGNSSGTLRICVEPPGSARFRPEFIGRSPASPTVPASPTLTLRVTARDAQDSPLSFSWTAGTGTLDAPASDATSSEVVWRAPSCMFPGAEPVVTVQVTNGLGLSASTRFELTGLEDCGTRGWLNPPPMRTRRQLHSMTVLPDGRVLVAGGYNRDTPSMNSMTLAELWDPNTGLWTPTGSMNVARRDHTATLLADGRVLVAGGSLTGDDAYSSAEIYNPATGAWTPTGRMNTPRAYHAAVPLPDGRVLVVGGTQFGATTELYDPKSGTWGLTGPMSVPRFYGRATLLADGRVLATGGLASGAAATAELYTPATGKWTATGRMNVGRRSHGAVLLPSGKVLVAGGFLGSVESATSELYDPATETWTPVGKLGMARVRPAAVLLPSGKVLLAGGANNSGHNAIATAELFDPATEAWLATGSMRTARDWFSAVRLPSGGVLVTGGANAERSLQDSLALYTE